MLFTTGLTNIPKGGGGTHIKNPQENLQFIFVKCEKMISRRSEFKSAHNSEHTVTPKMKLDLQASSLGVLTLDQTQLFS